MNYSIVFSEDADLELEDIIDYISQDNENNALKFSARMVSNIEEKLSFMPMMYREYKETMRIFPYGNYIIFYEINEKKKQVEILHIIHWARDLAEINF